MEKERDRDFYHKLRTRINAWAGRDENRSYPWIQWILVAPDLFHLLVRLADDPDVPIKEKTRLLAVIAYFLAPVDLLPEIVMGPTGFLDDVVLAAYFINGILNKTDGDVLQRHWAGEEDVLKTIRKILDSADRMLGSGLFHRLKRLLS